MNKEELLKLTGYPYYPMVPFIFERLNIDKIDDDNKINYIYK